MTTFTTEDRIAALPFIYLDMDDVVADWMGTARAIVNRNWNYGERIPDSDWNKVKAKARMYRDLPLKAGATDLVSFCQQAVTNEHARGLAFLTALPHDYSVQYAPMDKVEWAQRFFPGIPVFLGPFSHDKWRHCKPGDILIDDRTSNCEEWINVGGHSHIYRTWEACRPWLEQTLNPMPEL
jgi:5'(3')-deoxyribonucleotidase